MPFGRIFAALFFALCAWVALGRLSAEAPAVRAAAALLGGLGLLLALALLTRSAWPRWTALLAALGLCALAVSSAPVGAEELALAVLLGGVATVALLAWPGTGRMRGSTPLRAGGVSRWLGAAAALCAVGLLFVAPWAYRSQREVGSPAEPASFERPGRVRWSDFGDAIERARREHKPLLVTFVASWCGYCKKMDRSTWKHPSVIERVAEELVAARVDTDDTRELNGYVGVELAARYQVQGTPTTLLLDPSGSELARAGGYRSPSQLLTWLDRSLRGPVSLSRTRP